jgi:hypothetical protein
MPTFKNFMLIKLTSFMTYPFKVGSAWSVVLEPVAAGQICQLKITQDGQEALVIKVPANDYRVLFC